MIIADHTDRMHFDNISPWAAYDEHLKHLKNAQDFSSINFDQFLHKLFGGRFNSSYNEIVGEIQNGLDSLFDDLDTADNIFKASVSFLRKHAHLTFEQLKAQINAAIPDDKNFIAPRAVRQQTGTGPLILNRIQGSGTFKKIFEVVKSHPEMANVLEALLGIDKEGALKRINPNRSLYQITCGLYTLLEMLGYWSDRKLKLERRFPSFLSDQLHTANSIFTKAIFTRDKPLAMKAGAIYEFLGIGTKVIYIGMS
jgi:hypothetical protein